MKKIRVRVMTGAETTTDTITESADSAEREDTAMKKYDYLTQVTADVIDYICNEIDRSEWVGRLDELEEYLNDTLWAEDSVTGNASGSYTFNAYRAEEYLCHNLDLLAEAAQEFGGDIDILKSGAESCDVTIRCYLLGQAISIAISDLAEMFEDEDEEV